MSAPPAIRRAVRGDARAIAEVHVRSWQWAYRGLLPDDYLDRMSDTIDRRVTAHEEHLAHETPEQRTWIVEREGQVVGFAVTGPSRDPGASPHIGEVWGIYLHPEATGRGIGRALFQYALNDLWKREYVEATLWVLEGNVRARGFYEKAGWTADGAVKVEERPGALLHEVRYRVAREQPIKG